MRNKKISHEDTENTKMNENEIGRIIVDTAVAVHKEVGPGLLETVYKGIRKEKGLEI